MTKNIRKFVNREFARTVELDLLRRLLEPYRSKLNFDFATLPKDERSRREALFEFFRMADESFPSEFQDALHCIMVLSNPNGLRILQEQADRVGVQLIPEQEIEGEDDGRHLTPRHVALRAYLDHHAIFDRALDLYAFVAAPSPLEFVGAREGIESRHEDPDSPRRSAGPRRNTSPSVTWADTVTCAGTRTRTRSTFSFCMARTPSPPTSSRTAKRGC